MEVTGDQTVQTRQRRQSEKVPTSGHAEEGEGGPSTSFLSTNPPTGGDTGFLPRRRACSAEDDFAPLPASRHTAEAFALFPFVP